MITFENKVIKVEFAPECGGFPSAVKVKYPDREIPVLHLSKPVLQIGLMDGRKAYPYLPPGYQILKQEKKDLTRYCFDRLECRDDAGKTAEGFYVSCRYEFYDDGTVFVQTFFISENYEKPAGLTSYSFDMPLDFRDFSQIQIPYGMAADLSGGREEEASFRSCKKEGITHNFNFNCRRPDGMGGYFEVFMEDARALDHTEDHKESSIQWEGRSPRINWNFQSVPAEPDRCFVWTSLNQWGWLFTAPPRQRRNPPLRMIHVIDYFEQRIPTPHLVDLIAEEGADVIILHEEWRSDIESFACPHDREKLQAFIEAAHRHDIRVCLYIRGNDEITTVEDCCDWFGMYLKKDYDGLYADYGGVGNSVKRQHMKQHYLKYRRIREIIGPHGLYFAHCGCLSGGIGLTPDLIDGYTSGEGEQGALGSSRFLHECLSGSYLTTGTFWTAAFPHYGQEAMVPFMAAAGQYPHVPLGHQYHTSSLSHPQVPGLNTRALRGLWKLWETFREGRDLLVFNDFNSAGIIQKDGEDTEDTGVYLMIDSNRSRALLILSNFAREKRRVWVKIDWSAVPFDPGLFQTYQLQPDSISPGKAVLWSRKDYSAELPASGCAGFLIGKKDSLAGILERFERPYPELSAEAEEHIRLAAEQKELRKAPSVPQENLYLQLHLPSTHIPFVCGFAFYTIDHEIGTMDEQGKFIRRGYITLDGFSQKPPTPEKILWSLKTSPWVSLREIFPEGGKHTVWIRSFNPKMGPEGTAFHSLIEAALSPVPEMVPGKTKKLIFYNEAEPYREMFHFGINLAERS